MPAREMCAHACQLSVRIEARVFRLSHGRNTVAGLRRRRSNTSRPSHESRRNRSRHSPASSAQPSVSHAGLDRRFPRSCWPVARALGQTTRVRPSPALLRSARPTRPLQLPPKQPSDDGAEKLVWRTSGLVPRASRRAWSCDARTRKTLRWMPTSFTTAEAALSASSDSPSRMRRHQGARARMESADRRRDSHCDGLQLATGRSPSDNCLAPAAIRLSDTGSDDSPE